MSMYECNRCGGAVGLFCVCSPAALAQPAPVQAGAQQAADEPIAVVVERDGQRGRFVCETIFGFTPFVGAKLYDAPVQQDAPAPSMVGDAMTCTQIDRAAQTLAACMDYPWEHMPEQGRNEMRKHAWAIVGAAISQVGDAKGGA